MRQWSKFLVLSVVFFFLNVVETFSPPAHAAWITKQGVSWDTDWLPTTATLIHKPVANTSAADSPVFTFGASWGPANWSLENHKTVGQLAPLVNDVYNHGGKTLSVNLGPGIVPPNGYYSNGYAEIELSWGFSGGHPRGFQNGDGYDLAIYENGYPPERDSQGFLRGGSEVFLVSLGYLENGSLSWTNYRYTKPTSFEPDAKWADNNSNPNDGNFNEIPSWASGPTYLTLIEASEFGLSVDTWIVGVRIRNAVWFRDWVTHPSGQGWVTLNTTYDHLGSTYHFRDTDNSIIDYYIHPKNNTPEFRYDPDITIVVPLREVQPVPSPEPTTAILSISGLAAVLFARRKARRREIS